MIKRTRFANGPRARTRSGDGAPEPPPFWNVKRRGVRGVSPRTGHRAAALFAKRRLTFAALLLLGAPAHAAGSGMPWEAPLQKILESIEGPVAKVSAVVIIIMTGLSLAFGDMSGGLRRLIQIVFGLSIAFAATSFFLSFFSFAGGALIN
jgi:type IV secretion system protein TrbC